MRNQDNFVNPVQYILEQLFIYDYNNIDDFQILKMKIWTLDSDFTSAEGGINNDTDVSNPTNHYRWLLNELTFFDLYKRTLDDELLDDELNFNQIKQMRIDGMVLWVKTINPNTGELNEDYEMAYSSRPTLLTDSQFQSLYLPFKNEIQDNQLITAFDITNKITSFCIDLEIVQAETQVNTFVPPDEVCLNILEKATEMQVVNDYNFVSEMNYTYDELLNIVTSLNIGCPDWEIEVDYVVGDQVCYNTINYICILEHISEDPFVPANWVSLNDSIGIINLPQRRVQVVLVKNDASHKGFIITGGGYRFVYLDMNGNIITNWPAEANIDHVNTTNPLENGVVETSFINFELVIFYQAEGETYLESLGFTVNSLPAGGAAPNDLTRDRFNIINARWINFNRLRESKMQDIGTRAIIESMVDAEIPNLLTDYENHLSEKQDHKTNYTNLLTEVCSEFN